jgi:hypothetical protein
MEYTLGNPHADLRADRLIHWLRTFQMALRPSSESVDAVSRIYLREGKIGLDPTDVVYFRSEPGI